MEINKDIIVIRELLGLSQQELAKKLNTSFETINRWENNKIFPEDKNIEQIYSFAYDNKVYLNKIYESMYKDKYQNNKNVVLFHGAKKRIEDNINLSHSKSTNDFGIGFYLGETFEQAATYISYTNSNTIYSYKLDKNNLKIISFSVNEEWMYAIAYYRGWIDKYKNNKIITSIIEKVDKADVIIAPIADNKMFDLIGEYVEGLITDLQCINALSATNLGFQYVIKTENAISQLSQIKEMYLCFKEKDDYLNKRLENNKVGLDKVKVARIEYKNKGKYIEEELK